MDRKTMALLELRATLGAMLKDPKRDNFALVLTELLDRGNISEIAADNQPFRYMVVGVQALEEIEPLIAAVENPIHVACLQLSLLGQTSFGLEKANLRFFAVERLT